MTKETIGSTYLSAVATERGEGKRMCKSSIAVGNCVTTKNKIDDTRGSKQRRKSHHILSPVKMTVIPFKNRPSSDSMSTSTAASTSSSTSLSIGGMKNANALILRRRP
mmetsp:Transcript_8043/g.17443  ORF Transcript_8043/g.17443 Transcript_8043/m.17443 type:complete len:108 (-) Transcript_8043:107-430(-)